MEIDIEKLREDMKQDCYGAYFVGGFGGALVETIDIERASFKELIKMAELNGMNIDDYKI